jgi:glycosyltransferase involved in cell wall biosynthesis
MIRKTILTLAPSGSLRRRALKKSLRLFGYKPVPLGYYHDFYLQNREFIQLTPIVAIKEPLISIVVPAYNTPTRYLLPLIYSIVSQAYTNWELIVVDGSNDATASKQIASCKDIDKRIQVIKVVNGGISKNTNAGLKIAKGEFIAFADHDDVLDEVALKEVGIAISKYPEAGIIYSDEDKISDDGTKYFDPFFKPDWSPALFERVNYINHFCVIKKSLLDEIGFLNPDMDGAQDYDLLLRATDTDAKIVHIPKVLYHWRATNTSTALDFDSKPNITKAAKKSLEDHFKRLNIKVGVRIQKGRPGFYEIKYEPYKSLSLFIAPFSNEKVISLYLNLLMKRTEMSDISLQLIVPEGVTLELKQKEKIAKINYYDPSIKNYLFEAIQASTDNPIIMMNKILFPKHKQWIETLSGYLRDERSSTVAPVIVQEEEIIEDNGLIEQDELLMPFLLGYPANGSLTYLGVTDWPRNVVALSGSIGVVRKNNFLSYLKQNQLDNSHIALLNYSHHEYRDGQQNVITADIRMSRESLNVQSALSSGPNLLNSNIRINGSNWELVAPDSGLQNVLFHMNEREDGHEK